MKKVILFVVLAALVAWWSLAQREDGVLASQDRGALKPVGDLDSAHGNAQTGIAADAPESASEADRAKARGGSPEYYLTARPRELVSWRGWPTVPPLQLPPAPFAKRYPDALEARSPEEAAWLDRHGYPTVEELEALNTTTEQELAERAARGDLAAMALLGTKQMRANKTTEGYSNLNEAAMLGSIWAILQLADEQKRIGNIADALALYNLAALRGDGVGASLRMVSGLPAQIMQATVISVPSRMASQYANMQRLRALRGLPPLGVEMRPHPFNRPGGHDPIGVYPRRRSGGG